LARGTASLLEQLHAMRRCYGPGCAEQCEVLLAKLRGREFSDVQEFIPFHDTLLFLRAFPQSMKVVQLCEGLLSSIAQEAVRFRDSPEAAAFDDESVSGIAGTILANTWTFELARDLARRHSHSIAAEWNVDEQYQHMATILPDRMPLMEDDSYVEADTPYLQWVNAAAGGERNQLNWLLRSFDALQVSPRQRTSLYDALGVSLSWDLTGSPASRTLARRAVSQYFCHDAPLLQRRDVSLQQEMASSPLKLKRLSEPEAQKIINMARDALAVRYRELHGSTHADPKYAFQANVGRGVQLFIWGLDLAWRLPLRAYYAGFTLKNGVPINYFEAIGLFEWIEVGFNTFYAFREGETAWVYSKVLHLLHQLAGMTCFSVYPYQIGLDNEEAIQSGAFWFYRKLGFRPGRPDLLALTEREEKKIAGDGSYRTSARTLRKLAESHMFFEVQGSTTGRRDTFSTRTLGLAVQQNMAAKWDGDAEVMRRETAKWLAGVLGVTPPKWNSAERWAFSNFACLLALVPEIARWPKGETRLLVDVIRAKAGADETTYLRLLQQHDPLSEALRRIATDALVQPAASNRSQWAHSTA
jgi:hypothetical protein